MKRNLLNGVFRTTEGGGGVSQQGENKASKKNLQWKNWVQKM